MCFKHSGPTKLGAVGVCAVYGQWAAQWTAVGGAGGDVQIPPVPSPAKVKSEIRACRFHGEGTIILITERMNRLHCMIRLERSEISKKQKQKDLRFLDTFFSNQREDLI